MSEEPRAGPPFNATHDRFFYRVCSGDRCRFWLPAGQAQRGKTFIQPRHRSKICDNHAGVDRMLCSAIFLATRPFSWRRSGGCRTVGCRSVPEPAHPTPPARITTAAHRGICLPSCAHYADCASAARRSAKRFSSQARARSAAVVQVGVWSGNGGSGAAPSIVAIRR
jgi:hypothetical protein